MRRIAALALVVFAVSAACRRGPGAGGSGADGPSGAALALVEEGRFDEAIARVGDGADPASLYVLGRAWAGKAETAPIPTPAPGAVVPPEGFFKQEELAALDFFEKAAAARPEHVGTQLAIGRLLAPHALAWAAAERALGKPLPRGTEQGPDASPERVLRAFSEALQSDPAGVTAAEELIHFATAAGRLAEADAGYQELLRRKREDPDLLIRYGDFLAGPKGSPDAALSQYAQALIWRPEDTVTRTKMVDIHLHAAQMHLDADEYAGAEARLGQARRVGITGGSSQARRLREIETALRAIRGR